jgi:UDP-glucose 4-epimerase
VKVVVTGGSGFLGSHIADALSAAGHETVIFDVAPSPWLQPDQTMVVGSVLDPDKIASALRGTEAIYHLAAMADIADTLDHPREAVEINVMGTVNMLEAARAIGVRRFVFASSITVYPITAHFTARPNRHAKISYTTHERFGRISCAVRPLGPRADDKWRAPALVSGARRTSHRSLWYR